jgi:hypothetical protein
MTQNVIHKPYRLLLFLPDVTFAPYVALLQLISILQIIKQTQPSVAQSTSHLTMTHTGR